MSERIGRFEIINQIAQSSAATVYKALDTDSEQTVALKVVRLDQVADREAFLKRVLDEAEQAKALAEANGCGFEIASQPQKGTLVRVLCPPGVVNAGNAAEARP